MVLKKVRKGASRKQRRKVASQNIATEIRAGRPRKQAVAIGLRSAGLGRRGKGGRRKKRRR